MVGMVATASSLAQFASIYPSAGSFITYITRAIGTRVAVAVGVITILGYIIAFGGIYIFAGSHIAQNVFGNPHLWGLTQIITIAHGVLVVAPVVLGLRFGVRVTVALYAVIISGIIYVVGSYALVIAFGVVCTSVLAADPNPFHTAAKAFISHRRLTVCGRNTAPSDRRPGACDRPICVSVNRFLWLVPNSPVPRSPVVDLLVSNHIGYLGAEKQRMGVRRTLRPGSARQRTRY
jgi:hypothetical protein